MDNNFVNLVLISCLKDSFKPESYETLMMLHLCDGCDVVQANFVWQRIPDSLKKVDCLVAAKLLTDNLKELKFSETVKMLGNSQMHKILKRVL